jgi:hypothetical protein
MQFAPRSKPSTSVTETSHIMLNRKIICVFSEVHIKCRKHSVITTQQSRVLKLVVCGNYQALKC